jgi:hypothetical protein
MDAARNGAIKVVIVGVPGLLAAVVRKAVDEEPGMEVVAQVGSDDLAGVLREHVDIVVTAYASPDLPPAFRALLSGDSALPVVALSFEGDRIDVYGRSHGGGVEVLIDVIRNAVAAARPRTWSTR